MLTVTLQLKLPLEHEAFGPHGFRCHNHKENKKSGAVQLSPQKIHWGSVLALTQTFLQITSCCRYRTANCWLWAKLVWLRRLRWFHWSELISPWKCSVLNAAATTPFPFIPASHPSPSSHLICKCTAVLLSHYIYTSLNKSARSSHCSVALHVT